MSPPPATAAGAEPEKGSALGRSERRHPITRPVASRVADQAYVWLCTLAALAAMAGVGYLIYKTAAETGEVWSTYGIWGFLTGTEWIPQPADGQPVFGALPFIYGTLVTSAIAMALAVPLAIGVALATTVFLPRVLRGPVSAVVDLLAAVPSVVYGLWGILVLVPTLRPALEWVSEHNGPLGFLAGPVTSGSYLLSGMVLAIMVLPIIAAITREVFLTVPVDQQEGAYALGATRWEMVRDAMLPWARSGIVGASALGLGRAVGETIALALLLGNVPNVGGSLLGPGSTLAGVIALEFGEAFDVHLAALTALALVLFVIAFIINALARLLVARSSGGGESLVRRALTNRGLAGLGTIRAREQEGGDGLDEPADEPGIVEPPRRLAGLPSVSTSRRVRSYAAEGTVYLALALALIPLGAILYEIVRNGLPAISWDFLTTEQPPDAFTPGGGISNALVGTLIMMGIATAVAAPLGVLTALFINDVAAGLGPGFRRIGDAVGFFVDILLGVPSVVVGLTVYLALVLAMGNFSALAGGIALGIIMFPIVVRATDEILRLVPEAQREAAEALGAPRWRTTVSVVLPAAAPGILTGTMLALARASGEAAPLLFTSLGWQFLSTDVLAPIAALPQLIFANMVDIQTPESTELAWGAAFVLVAMILFLNLIARLIARFTRSLEVR